MFLRGAHHIVCKNFCKWWEDEEKFWISRTCWKVDQGAASSISLKKEEIIVKCIWLWSWISEHPFVSSSLPSQKDSPASSSTIYHQVFNSSFGKYNKLSLHFTLYTNHVYIFSNCLLLIYNYLYYLLHFSAKIIWVLGLRFKAS